MSVLMFLVILLLLAVFPLPDGYYFMLHIAVCFCLVYEILTDTTLTKETNWMFIAIVILYNPIIKIPFSRTLWIIVNILTAAFLAYQLRKTKQITKLYKNKR